ncbi:hypothetical protein AN189_03725 [Loktanella sp. 3ANDIMAR09]|uniref:hypothetical protein n=1 Tax=Loktanella sp. 3ANDIMAR09 TaxID=1225657 RepID=UPI0006F6457F|nr:hypothetical protein [Loktanella sp. 3ANDIMAR09]KQI69521.1 hypothetical protein AN189_03725 [Loktanella sp. 3ANDIMAR09]
MKKIILALTIAATMPMAASAQDSIAVPGLSTNIPTVVPFLTLMGAVFIIGATNDGDNDGATSDTTTN